MVARSRVKRKKKRSAKQRSPARTRQQRTKSDQKVKPPPVSRSKLRPRPQFKTESKPRAFPNVVEAALAAFAHEVRTPLTGILAISDLLATSDLGERERRWVDTIKAGAEHLSALATVFVDAAKPEKAKAVIRDDLFDVRALARAAADSLAGRAAAKGLACEVSIADNVPSLVSGDPIRLRAALENLIDNAVKFTEQGGVALDVSASPRTAGAREKTGGDETSRTSVTFAVADSGIGLTLPEIKRLFRPFSQANVSIASRFGGAGLGLSSVKQLARAMGGDIKASQRAGGGTTFLLTVTLAPAGPGSGAKPGAAGEAVSQPYRSLRILSVEDNPFGRVVLNTILTELGHQAEFIGRGEDAMARIEQGAFDCVLMDMVLPGIDGIEAIGRIRRLGPPHGHIPVIGVSGRAEDDAAARAAGADAFLLKPVSPRALATALLEAIRREAAAT
jgi:two-component system, sensor histidine kinase